MNRCKNVVPEGIDAPAVCKAIRDVYGVTIAGGQEQLKPRLIRVGHMGFVSRHDVMAGLSALELALRDCGMGGTPGAAVSAPLRGRRLRQSAAG